MTKGFPYPHRDIQKLVPISDKIIKDFDVPLYSPARAPRTGFFKAPLKCLGHAQLSWETCSTADMGTKHDGH